MNTLNGQASLCSISGLYVFCRCSVRVQTTCLVFLFQSNLSRKVIVLSSEQQSTIVLRSRVRTGSVDTEPDNINNSISEDYQYINQRVICVLYTVYYNSGNNREDKKPQQNLT